MKKPYEKPTMEFVEFRPEERLAGCCFISQGSPDFCSPGQTNKNYTSANS